MHFLTRMKPAFSAPWYSSFNSRDSQIAQDVLAFQIRAVLSIDWIVRESGRFREKLSGRVLRLARG